MRINFDNCALGRLFDDRSHPLVKAEAVAVQRILDDAGAGRFEWIASEMLLLEIRRNPDLRQRANILSLVEKVPIVQPITMDILLSARSATQQGLGHADAVHLFSALTADCQVLLTTDIRFIRQSAKLPALPPRFVRNPIDL